MVAERFADVMAETEFGMGHGSSDSVPGWSYFGKLSEYVMRFGMCANLVPISSGGIHPGGKWSLVRPLGSIDAMSKGVGPGTFLMSKS